MGTGSRGVVERIEEAQAASGGVTRLAWWVARSLYMIALGWRYKR